MSVTCRERYSRNSKGSSRSFGKKVSSPANNSAERALGPDVQWRKASFGSRSPEGEVAVARLLTVAHTCRLRNVLPLAFLAAAIRAHRKALPVNQLSG